MSNSTACMTADSVMGATYGENHDHSRDRRHRKHRPTHRRSPDRPGRQRHPCTDKEPGEGKPARRCDGRHRLSRRPRVAAAPRSRHRAQYLAPLPETLDTTLVPADQGDTHGPGALPSAVEAPISMDDIARVAAAPLVKPDESHFGQDVSARARRSGVGIGVPIRYEQCDRAEAEAAFQTALGPERGVVSRPGRRRRRSSAGANDLVAELTGSPASRWPSGPRRTPNCSADYRC